MKRGNVIATVAAATGVLLAGMTASVAVVNAAASSSGRAQSIQLVAASEPAPSLTAPPTVDSAAAVSPASDSAAPSASRSTASPSSSASRTKRPSPSATSDDSPSQAATTNTAVTSAQARRAVLKATTGTVVATSRVQHKGASAWAVRVHRPDGSLVTGYVHARNGVVYDWTVNRRAPVATASPNPSASPSRTGSDDGPGHDAFDDHGSNSGHDGSDDGSDDRGGNDRGGNGNSGSGNSGSGNSGSGNSGSGHGSGHEHDNDDD